MGDKPVRVQIFTVEGKPVEEIALATVPRVGEWVYGVSDYYVQRVAHLPTWPDDPSCIAELYCTVHSKETR